jgi:mannose-6-phosphate isomerase
MGAHPGLPSYVTRAGQRRTLGEWIALGRERELGPAVAASFESLPFLMKVLAAAEPLSLQAHPSEAQAREGFAREDAAGVPRQAKHRNYRDPHHKPELICALTPFEALCGFRAPRETGAMFATLGCEGLDICIERLLAGDLRAAVEQLFALDASSQRTLANAVTQALAKQAGADTEPTWRATLAWAKRLATKYPGDLGIVTSMLLNHVTLAPGEALYLDAGHMHAYLEGLGIEIMANSDNVLRGGLTEKHVDPKELLRVLRFEAMVPDVLRAEPDAFSGTSGTGGSVYHTPAREFELTRYELSAERGAVELGEREGPEVWISTLGTVTLDTCVLHQGEPAYASAAELPRALRASGAATVFRARVPI